jgi:hypothetical protein
LAIVLVWGVSDSPFLARGSELAIVVGS